MLKKELLKKRRLVNILQSFIIITGTAFLLGLVSYLIFGIMGLVVSLLILFIVIIFIPNLKPFSIIKSYKGERLEYSQVPNLYNMVYELSKYANLKKPPMIYYIPSSAFISFSTGTKDNSAIALSDGILRLLSYEEIYGVLGHEISHIKNNDIWLMQVCDISSRLTSVVSYGGQFIMLILSPFLLLSDPLYFWSLFILFLVMPIVTILMQLSLSRIREYGADLDSVSLTGSSNYLKSALFKLDRVEGGILKKIFNPFNKSSEPSVLRTHPSTKSRIERLEELDIPDGEEMRSIPKDDLFLKSTVLNIKPRRKFLFWN